MTQEVTCLLPPSAHLHPSTILSSVGSLVFPHPPLTPGPDSRALGYLACRRCCWHTPSASSRLPPPPEERSGQLNEGRIIKVALGLRRRAVSPPPAHIGSPPAEASSGTARTPTHTSESFSCPHSLPVTPTQSTPASLLTQRLTHPIRLYSYLSQALHSLPSTVTQNSTCLFHLSAPASIVTLATDKAPAFLLSHFYNPSITSLATPITATSASLTHLSTHVLFFIVTTAPVPFSYHSILFLST